MPDARHFCPECGSIDIVVDKVSVVSADEAGHSTATCPNCSWSGSLSDSVGAVTSDQFWDAEKIGEVLLRVIATNASGPLIQALEFVGLLPKDAEHGGNREWATYCQDSRDHVMRQVFEVAVVAAFTAAGEVAQKGEKLRESFKENSDEQVRG